MYRCIRDAIHIHVAVGLAWMILESAWMASAAWHNSTWHRARRGGRRCRGCAAGGGWQPDQAIRACRGCGVWACLGTRRLPRYEAHAGSEPGFPFLRILFLFPHPRTRLAPSRRLPLNPPELPAPLFPRRLTMYSTLVSVALFSALAIQGALADFTVDTPTVTQVPPFPCSPT